MGANDLLADLTEAIDFTEALYLRLSHWQVDSKADLGMKNELLNYLATACDALLECRSILDSVKYGSSEGLTEIPEVSIMGRES